jgi:hypothetical protein
MPSLCHTAVCIHGSFVGTPSKEQLKCLPSAVALCTSSKSLHFYWNLCSCIQTVCLHFVHTEFYTLVLPYWISPTRNYSISYGHTFIFSIFAKGNRISWSEDLAPSNVGYVRTPWAKEVIVRSNDYLIEAKGKVKDSEGNGLNLVVLLCWLLPAETEKYHKFMEVNGRLNRDLNTVHLGYETTRNTFPLR